MLPSMRRRGRRTLTLTASLGLVAAVGACGSDVLGGESPQQILKGAIHQQQTGAFHYTLSGRLSTDTSSLHNVSASTIQALVPLAAGLTLSGSGDQESAKRVSLRVSEKSSSGTRTACAVLYDGVSYGSVDCAKYAEGGAVSGLTQGVGTTPADIGSYLSGVASIVDAGSTTDNGVAVRHLRGTFDKRFVDSVMTQPTTDPQAQQLYQFLGQLASLKSGAYDVYVDESTGAPERVTIAAQISIDFGALGRLFGGTGASAPSGAVVFGVNLDEKLSVAGQQVSVTKPVVDPSGQLPPGGILGVGG